MLNFCIVLFLFVGVVVSDFYGKSGQQNFEFCNPKVDKLPDHILKHHEYCTDKYPVTSFSGMQCSNLCYWKRMRFFTKNGMIAESRVREISSKMYSNPVVATARALYFSDCINQFDPHINAADVLKNNCAKFKAFSDCILTRRESPCRSESEVLEIPNPRLAVNIEPMQSQPRKSESEGPKSEAGRQLRILKCRPGFKKVSADIIAYSQICQDNTAGGKKYIQTAACFKLCIWSGLRYFFKNGTINEKRVRENAVKLYDNRQSIQARIGDFTRCQNRYNTNVGRKDILDDGCVQFKPFHDCVLAEMEKPCNFEELFDKGIDFPSLKK